VLLIDDGLRPGGQIWRHRDHTELPRGAQSWLQRLEQSGATVLSSSTVVDVRPDRSVVVETPSGPVIAQTKGALVLCAGARERFLPFPGWTLPGVVGVGGGQALIKSGLDVRGVKVVVAGSGPLLLPVAALLAKRGAAVKAVLEQAPLSSLLAFALELWRTPARIADALLYRFAFARTRYQAGHWVTRAQGTDRVSSAVISDGARTQTIACDLLCVGYGLVPATELPRLAGCAVDARGSTITGALQQTSVEGVYCAGETTGIGGVDAALVEGEIAGLAASGAQVEARALMARRALQRAFAERMERAFQLRAELRALAEPDTLVCRCEDVRMGDLVSCSSARAAKLHTRAGMGPCQGRVCGSAMSFLFGWEADSVRPPVAATSVGSLAEL
jgi:NADPH-dependent 2,4-dienoyl-CoA reductase/sulfur reductase-like enzyme